MKSKIILILSVAVLFIFTSCATILGGSKKGVRVKGEPKNAEVYYNGSYVGQSPISVKVPKSSKAGNSKITIKADNYKSTDIQLTRSWSIGYTVLDILTGTIWLVFDGVSGNIYQPKPSSVKFNLEPIDNNLFKIGDKVSFTNKDLANITGEVTNVMANKLTVKYTRPANLIEKQTKKVDQITEEKEFYFNEVKK